MQEWAVCLQDLWDIQRGVFSQVFLLQTKTKQSVIYLKSPVMAWDFPTQENLPFFLDTICLFLYSHS